MQGRGRGWCSCHIQHRCKELSQQEVPWSASTQFPLLWETLRLESHSTNRWMLLTLISLILQHPFHDLCSPWKNTWTGAAKMFQWLKVHAALWEDKIWVPEQTRHLTTAYDSSSKIQYPLLPSMGIYVKVHTHTCTHIHTYIKSKIFLKRNNWEDRNNKFLVWYRL